VPTQEILDQQFQAIIETRGKVTEYDAAAKIQALFRANHAKETMRKMRNLSAMAAERYFARAMHNRLEERERQKKIRLMKEKLYNDFGNECIERGTHTVMCSWGAVHVQRVWRGYLTRTRDPDVVAFINARKRRNRKKHYARLDVHRRVWARESFRPTGGWPVKPQEERKETKYDMFQYAKKPPRGTKYGVKISKV
jgi:hypothetical protein